MATPSSSSSTATLPFHSSQVREALVTIISNHNDGREERQDLDDAIIVTKIMKTTLHHGHVAIRGKWCGYDSSSSNSDDNGNEDENSSTSTSSNRSLLTSLVEENGDDNNEVVEDHHTTSRGRSVAAASKPRMKKAHNNKDDKNALLQKMGRPPTILLPLDVIPPTTKQRDHSTKKTKSTSSNSNDSSTTMKAIEIPSVLLPINYLRNNPNWKVTSVAQTLLSYWERLNNNITITSSSSSSPTSFDAPTIIVVLLQSGRFASAVYTTSFVTTSSSSTTSSATMVMVAHKTSTRYTVRKGQGGSQSNFDSSKHKAKSIGAQLRREGERQLRQDVHDTWNKWKNMGYVKRAVGVYVSCPKSMKRDYLFMSATDDVNSSSSHGLMNKKDDRWRNIPLDVGRPTLDATSAVLESLMSCTVRDMTEEECRGKSSIASSLFECDVAGGNKHEVVTKAKNAMEDTSETREDQQEESMTPVLSVKPYTPLHEAIIDGDLNRLLELLHFLELKESNEKEGVDETTTSIARKTSRDDDQNNEIVESIEYDVNTGGGPDGCTPLHLASSSTHPNATALLSALLLQGHANPCAVDARGRPPYFLAASDKHRDSFRLARGTLGEEYCLWDECAKVGPALTESDMKQKKAKALEKKRRQRARQKETRAIEKEEAEREQAEEQARLNKLKEEEDAKRIRDGLQPKSSSSGATNVCDFCQQIVKGKRRSQMFQRLDYAYCTTECVKRHQRELMAAAATARLGGGGNG